MPIYSLEAGAFLRFMHGDCIDEMVKSGAEVVDTVAADQSEVLKGNISGDFEENAVSGAVSVRLLDGSICVRVIPRKDFTLESIKVFFGPPLFCTHTGEV